MASIVGHRDHLHEIVPFSMTKVGLISNATAAAHSVSKGHDLSFIESLELDLAMDGVNADPVNEKWSSVSKSVLVCDEDDLLVHFADEELAKDNDSTRWQSEDEEAEADAEDFAHDLEQHVIGGISKDGAEEEMMPDVQNLPPTSPFSNPSPGVDPSEELGAPDNRISFPPATEGRLPTPQRTSTDVDQSITRFLDLFESHPDHEAPQSHCSDASDGSSSIRNAARCDKLRRGLLPPSRMRNPNEASKGLMFFEWGKVVLDPLRRSKIERWKTQKLSIITGRSTPKKYPKRQSYAQSRQRKNGRFINNKNG